MHTIRTIARLGALPAAAAVVLLSVVPASAHVSGTPSVATAGSYTILTMSVPHGCDGSPTTKVEFQIPESVVSVTPTRNPLYDLQVNMEQLDEPITDTHGNEVTERVGSITYTASTPLPEGQRDTFELSFQVPDAAGETLAFPTLQTCEQGRTDWVQVAEDGSDGEELEYPAPAFEILPAEEGGDGHGGGDEAADEASAETDTETAAADTEEASAESSNAVGWAGLVLGTLGLLAGGLALVRSRSTT